MNEDREEVFHIKADDGGWLLARAGEPDQKFARRDLAVIEAMCTANEHRPSRVIVCNLDQQVEEDIAFRPHMIQFKLAL